ncbi:hypothetical protein CLV34_2347 [Luteimicrobium subarcticum]|uniref:Uncharacterized protein n=1 Tax=Luteimicrobium subarcticum TaxID=620910 RepID=A0A2M8WJJ2_9MICO|nr:hypothetical protein CLV34_2347 [Luteimicrobium subarcticum]
MTRKTSPTRPCQGAYHVVNPVRVAARRPDAATDPSEDT